MRSVHFGSGGDHLPREQRFQDNQPSVGFWRLCSVFSLAARRRRDVLGRRALALFGLLGRRRYGVGGCKPTKTRSHSELASNREPLSTGGFSFDRLLCTV